jgi:hypothetical protein
MNALCVGRQEKRGQKGKKHGVLSLKLGKKHGIEKLVFIAYNANSLCEDLSILSVECKFDMHRQVSVAECLTLWAVQCSVLA